MSVAYPTPFAHCQIAVNHEFLYQSCLLARTRTRMSKLQWPTNGMSDLPMTVPAGKEAWRYAELVTQLKRLPADGPIVFEDRTVSMAVLHSHPALHARCSLIDFSDNQLNSDSRLRLVQRDVGRRIVQWYPAYTMRSLDSLENERTFFVIPYVESPSASLLWPADHRKSSVSPRIDRYDRKVPESSTLPLE